MGTAAGMLAEARKSLGLSGRPNYITRDYASRHGAAFLTAPWCDMAVTYWARRSGNADTVLPAGDRAYTPWHAADFQKIGRWYPGTPGNVRRAKPGDIVFFDWGFSDSIGAIDHVGVVEKALPDGRLATIEGNTGDRCLRRIRSASVIAGYGRPDYSGSSSDGSASEEDPLLGLKKGDKGERVQALQEMIRAAGQGDALEPWGTDGDYGDATAEALRLVRVSVGSKAARERRDATARGERVDAWAFQQLHSAVARNQGKYDLKKV
ncbi:CHAP domain-containing protein [Actinomadura sediminis]|uniref:CHAP domain-containing protein n=1 Tax=Actinomadura sediminis TaxID=1038904 RepID=A0ABW3ES47_9ACTN